MQLRPFSIAMKNSQIFDCKYLSAERVAKFSCCHVVMAIASRFQARQKKIINVFV